MTLTHKHHRGVGGRESPIVTPRSIKLAAVKSKLTAVFQLQRAEGNLHVAREARHHLAVHVSAAAEVPLLEPVEVAGAGQGVVP